MALTLGSLSQLGILRWPASSLWDLQESPFSSTKKAALVGLTTDVRRFCKRAPGHVDQREWASELKEAKGCSNSYTVLDESWAACDVVFAEILPGLPDPNIAASIEARSLCDDEVLKFIDNPDSAVLPEDLWPPSCQLPVFRASALRLYCW